MSSLSHLWSRHNHYIRRRYSRESWVCKDVLRVRNRETRRSLQATERIRYLLEIIRQNRAARFNPVLNIWGVLDWQRPLSVVCIVWKKECSSKLGRWFLKWSARRIAECVRACVYNGTGQRSWGRSTCVFVSNRRQPILEKPLVSSRVIYIAVRPTTYYWSTFPDIVFYLNKHTCNSWTK